MRSRKFDYSSDLNAIALKHTPCNVFMLNDMGKIFFVNSTACEKLGYAYQKLTDMHIWDIDISNFSTYDKFIEFFENLEEGTYNFCESFFIKQNGKKFPVKVVGLNYIIKNERCSILYIYDNTEAYNLKTDKDIYTNMISSVNEYIFITDIVTSKIVFANKPACIASGYSFEELNQLYLRDIKKEFGQHHKFYDIVQKLKDIDNSQDYGLFITKKGEELPVEITTGIKNTNDNSYKICIFKHIPNRLRYEQTLNNKNKKLEKYTDTLLQEVRKQTKKLKYANERLTLALEGSSDGLLDWNIKTNEIYFSPKWKEILGYRPDELDNTLSTWEKMVVRDHKKISWQLFNEFLANTDPTLKLSFEMRHKTGRIIPIELHIKKVLDKNNQAIRIVGTYTDMTQTIEIKKQNELIMSKLRDNSQMLDTIFNSAQIGLIYIRNRIVEKVNNYTIEQLGYDNKYELIGQSARVFYTSDEDFIKFGKKYYPILSTQVIKDLRHTIQKKDGSHVQCILSANVTDIDKPADLNKGILIVAKKAIN